MGSDKNAVAVIVHGFGGMGKTTLADAVFARLFEKKTKGYKYSYVRLFDTIASVPDVVKLQRCILTDLMMGEESEIPEVRWYEEGQQVIEDMLEKEAAFIYIDNVLLPDKVEQGRDALHHLLPKNMRKARKLRLLLTTRDKDAVRIRGVKPVFYPIEGLPHEEALDLFKKTLDGDSLQQLDTDQLNHLVKICQGVPKLMMVVAGFISSEENVQQAYSAVLEESKYNWNGEIGNDMECCILAYQHLKESLKEIFLDICVFFQGWDWEELSDIVGESQLKMLEKRALVTKDVKSMTVRVHDVMLAIGLDKKGERFRFTRASDFEKFLKKDNDQLQKIKGIWSSDDSNLLYVPASKLDSMHRSLRVVILGKSTKVAGKCTEIFKELVIFRARDSDLPFDKSKLGEFKKLKLSHLICKSEDLEKLNEDHTPSIARSDVPSSSTSAVPSSSTPSFSVPKELVYTEQISGTAGAVDPGNVNADLNDLSNYISQYLAFIKHEAGKPLPVSAAKCDWPASKSLIKLKEVISGAAEIAKDWCPDAKTIAQKSLQGVGELHIMATGFLVLGNIMERYETISSNKEECLCLLERMNNLIQEVKQLKERPRLMEAMEAKIKEAMELIIEVSLACCTQIDRPKYKKFFSTTVNKKELQGFQTRLTELHRKIQLRMEFVLHGLLLRVPPCPRASKEFRRENRVQIEKVTELLKWKSEERAVAVILYGLGGTGKTALANAVYWSLYHEKVLPFRNHEEVLECKYSCVRLFEFITSVPDIPKLQTQVLQDLGSLQEIRRYEDGRNEIGSILEKEVVFIYIDNVLFPDKVEGGLDAIEQLLPRTTKKVRKLRLLITTPDKGAAVRACNNLRIKTELYPIETLEDTKAMQLVKEELNGRDERPDSNQINQIVQICGGIPQVLKEVAAYIGVSENRVEAQERYHQVIWERENDWNGRVGWNKIARRAFAHEQLDEKLKDPFFDICSYFEGWHWEELSNIVGKSELNSLEDRALVTKDVKSMTAKVNNFILAIGIHNKGRRFKFTSASEFQRVLNPPRDEDLCDIKGIWSNDNIGPLDIPARKLDLMCGSLRVLALENSTKVNGRCKEIFEKLFFFSAEISYLPVALGQMPSNLISNLRVLRLRESQQVHSLPESKGQFNLFDSINLSSTDLKELPDRFCSLSSLTEITMDNCRRLENLPDRFGEVRSLRKLSLLGCVSLKELPGSFSQLEYLEDLNLSGCVKLKKLPENFHGLPSLKHLYLSNCVELEATSMESIVKMETLQSVDIRRSPLLQEAWQNIEEVGKQWSHKVERTSGQGSSDEENVERNDDMQE